MKKLTLYKYQNVRNWVLLVLGLAIMSVFVLFAAIPDKIAPCDPSFSYEAFLPCSAEHLLGTNNLGYDIMSELIYATRSTLVVGLLAALIALGIGTVVGLLAGYIGGIVGEGLNGIINFFLLIPMLPLAIVIAAYLGAGQQNVIFTIAILGWCSTARAVRAKTMKIKSMPYVETMRGLGYTKARILFCHVMPNLADVIFAKYITSVAGCILLEATLGFLGLGDATVVTWGTMVNLAYKFGGLAMGAYNWFLAPGVCIMLLTCAFYLINQFIERKSRTVKGGKSMLE